MQTPNGIEAMGPEAVLEQALGVSHSMGTYGLTMHQTGAVIAFLETELKVAREAGEPDMFLPLWRALARIKAHAAKTRKANNQQAWAFELQIRAIRNRKEHA
jgi:hypothetical protein